MKFDKLQSTLLASCVLSLSACGGGGGGGDEPEPLPAFVSCVGTLCTVTGTVSEDFTMDAARQWQIDGVVKVGNGNVTLADAAAVTAAKAAGVTLTIAPGVSVKAFDDATLLITRGSQLIADGTAAAPITFSSLDDNFTGEGEWGGIIIQGFAPQFGKANTGACFGAGTVCNVAGEGGTFVGVYGGNDPADNSGVLRYVRIAEAGQSVGVNNEINGLTLQGVGHMTLLDYVQVHGSIDDGIEWFGGTVNAKHLVLTNNDDDDIDFDEGYKGNIQFAIVKKNQTKTAPTGANDPRAIEANSSNADQVTATQAVLSNLTLLGGPVNNAEGKTQPGILLRGAVTTSIFNTAVKGFNTGCVRIDDAVVGGVTTGLSVIGLTNIITDCTNGIYATVRVADTSVNVVTGAFTPDAAVALSIAAATLASPQAVTAVNNGSGFSFTATNYIGAVAPGTAASAAWWAGWTLPGTL